MTFTGFHSKIAQTGALFGLALVIQAYCGSLKPAGDPIRITVRVRDMAHIRPRILARAEENAGSVFKKAGVKIFWADCSASATPGHWDCPGEENVLTLGLWMLDSAPQGVAQHCLGFALMGIPGEPHALIIYPRTVDTAHGVDVEVETVLGVAMAHELGHLLFQRHGQGIMAGHWGPTELRRAAQVRMHFTPEQEQLMREHLSSRSNQ